MGCSPGNNVEVLCSVYIFYVQSADVIFSNASSSATFSNGLMPE